MACGLPRYQKPINLYINSSSMIKEYTWTQVRHHFTKCQKLNLHQVIASIDKDGMPRLTPIGTVFLNDDHTGFYFERYCATLPMNVTDHPEICIMAVNTGRLYWFRSLFLGRFKGSPAVKLYGSLGQRRTATARELKRLHRRLNFAKSLKGYQLLWDDMVHVREFKISKTSIVTFGSQMPVVI